MYSHGGGWVLGSTITHAKLATDVSFICMTLNRV